MEKIELKHCPFCGGTATTYCCDESGGWEVSCDDCPCAMDWSYKTEDEAIDAWNRMADVELKPCQCGSAVQLCRGNDDYYIYCPKCKLETFSTRVYDNITDNCDRLIEVWNRRADDGKD